ncbi:MAG: LCP family protein [Coriobacteriia bacterium]|nr:LCP family protein [Coriobacteriia bacterium]MCL2537048.1 LCP family protein [Coriobacteriia bacterium]
MGKYSKKKSKWGLGRDRMRYEDSFDSGATGRRRKGESSTIESRVAREAAGAQISNTRLSAAGSLEKAPATLLAERDRRRRRNKKRAIIALSVVGALFLGAVAAGAATYWSIHSRMTVPAAKVPQALQDTPTPPPAEPFNVVIFGTDSRDPKQYDHTDTIILARVDPGQKKVWMVSVPRDTRVEVPGHGARKINAAYILGGPDAAIQAVEDVTGQDVDYFITVNFYGFEHIIDSMGGVNIDVPIAIDDRAADFTPDGRASRIAPGPQILDGAHALTFVRHRKGYADADIGRTRAQQLFFRAVIAQLSDVPMTRLPGLANSLANNVKTNFTPMQLLSLGREMRGVDPDNFFATTLPGEWRSPFWILDEAGTEEIWSNFGVRSFDPEEVDETDPEAEVAPSIAPQDVSVTVRNGTTRAGIAGEAAAILRARGFTVSDVGNTDNQSVYDENLIIFRDSREGAELIAQFMPDATRIVQSRGMFRFDTDVLVILGTEWDITQVPVADVVTE